MIEPRWPGIRAASIAAALAGCVIACLLGAGSAAARPPAQEAQRLFKRAQAYLQRGTIEGRREAAECLRQATLLDGRNVDYRLALGELYLRQGFWREGRLQFEAALESDSACAAAYLGLGEFYRHDYLKYLERPSLLNAIAAFAHCALLAPERSEAWVGLVPLHIEAGDTRAAFAAATRAVEADSTSVDARLAFAHSSYRVGDVDAAARDFALALPRLDTVARVYFEDIAPVASERDTFILRRLPTPAAKAEFVRRFWKSLDPDLGTAVNEAQVEFWSRAAQAYFLYYDRRRHEWDERGEVYVRYGPPEFATYNPVVMPYMERIWSLRMFPFNTLVWGYPSLGMVVSMTDRTLNGFYGLPPALYYNPDPQPEPGLLDAQQDRLLASSGGRGVFPRLPPKARPLPMLASVARFRAADGVKTRVVAALAAQAQPADSVWCEAVVLDSTMSEVARLERAPGVSACDPGAERAAQFDFDLPPGHYVVGLSVRDGDGRRAAWRAPLEVDERPSQLELSDLQVACGPAPEPEDPVVRVNPNPAAHVPADDPVGVYFEAYGLKPGSDGLARFTIEYTVRSVDRDQRPWIARVFSRREKIPTLSASRSAENPGDLRRQFVTIPAQSLPPGSYQLQIRLHDDIAGVEAQAETHFEKI